MLIAGNKSHGPGTHEYVKDVHLLKHCLETSPNLKGLSTEVHLDGWPADPKTLDDAVDAGWLFRGIWQYSTTAATWITPTVYDHPWLSPQEGFWMYSMVDGLVLNFPTEAQFETVRYLFPDTETGFWDFIYYCQTHWLWGADAYDDYGYPQLVQGPPVTFARMTGDCDDFATMVAYYAQEYWPYDSFIAQLAWKDKPVGHAVAFVPADPVLVANKLLTCGPDYPYYQQGGLSYIPIDYTPGECVSWTWANVEAWAQREWYDAVYERLDFVPNK